MAVRFYHTADIHLGAEPDAGHPWGGEKRGREIQESFRQLIARAGKEEIDLLLIAGDLFHRQPFLRELKEVNYLFSTIPRTKVVLMAGNHDYWGKDSFYEGFPWNENVIFLGKERCERVVFPRLHTAVYGLSYHAREIREPLYDALEPRDDGMFSILLAHGGDAQHIPMDYRRLQASGFSYIALGHIHRPQLLARNRMAYAGALEAIDKNDFGAHGFISGVYEDGGVRLSFVPFASREYRRLDISVGKDDTEGAVADRAADQIREQGAQHIYRLHLQGFRDPDLIFEPERFLGLGNVIDVQDDTEPAYDFEKLLRQHPDDVLGGLIRRLYRGNMDETERKALYYGVQALLGEGSV